MSGQRGVVSLLVLCVGCAAQPRAPDRERAELGAPSAATAPLASDAATNATRPAASASASASPSTSPPATSSAPPALPLDVTQVLSVTVRSIALGEGARLAVLADVPQIAAKGAFRPLPLPPALLSTPEEVEDAQIFFGRDNEPCIMGVRRSSRGERAVYLRHTARGWRDGREEIGPLGGTVGGGLWGVLGSADPELVCRANALCIVKRNSGWTTAPAGTHPRRVTLQGGVLWALDPSGIATIDARGWSTVLPAPGFAEPRALWASRAEAWVGAANGLFHFQKDGWSSLPSSIGEVNAVWGERPSSIWFAGTTGLAHYDGRALRRAALPGPFYAIAARSDEELWLGGQNGLFRVRPLSP